MSAKSSNSESDNRDKSVVSAADLRAEPSIL